MNKKYRIDEILETLPIKDYQLTIDQICHHLRKSRSQFNRMRKYTVQSTSAITSDDLIIIADVLHCSVDELLNKNQTTFA